MHKINFKLAQVYMQLFCLRCPLFDEWIGITHDSQHMQESKCLLHRTKSIGIDGVHVVMHEQEWERENERMRQCDRIINAHTCTQLVTLSVTYEPVLLSVESLIEPTNPFSTHRFLIRGSSIAWQKIFCCDYYSLLTQMGIGILSTSHTLAFA